MQQFDHLSSLGMMGCLVGMSGEREAENKE
jgi:hypothetical protein